MPASESKIYVISQHINEAILPQCFIVMASLPEPIPLVINGLNVLSPGDLKAISFHFAFCFAHHIIISLENFFRSHSFA